MRAEVDQSGQIGKFNTDTVLALADDEQFVIVIPAAVKRAAHEYLREKYREIREPYLRVFAAALFLLLKDHAGKYTQIVIDEEFTSKWSIIKAFLIGHLRKLYPRFDANILQWRQIGKQSSAHKLALNVYRSRRRKRKRPIKPNRIITKAELLALL